MVPTIIGSGSVLSDEQFAEGYMEEEPSMELDWSKQSPHIRTLYHPWQPGDGYEGNEIATAEAQLGIHLPASLRIFYQAWGRRKDMARINQFLIEPLGLVRRPDALVFCLENQGCCWWAIERQALEEPDPPVVTADPGGWSTDDIHVPLTWMPSHAHLSNFLDTLTYFHALSGGAIHGGYTEDFQRQESHNAWLEQHWHRMTVGPMAFHKPDDYKDDLPFYVRHGQALACFQECGVWFHGCGVAVQRGEDLDEIGQALQVMWKHRW